MGAVWVRVKLPGLREQVRPIYQRLGILPEVASGMQSASRRVGPVES